VFAGGAIVAGLPYGAAGNVQEAFEAMFQGRSRPARAWGDLVRAASPHRGPWPRVSVWHGDADATVKPMNAGEIVKQWLDVHGLAEASPREDRVNGYPHRAWHDASGRALVEEYAITGMAHGAPLAVGAGEEHCGAAGAFLLDVGISSSYEIAKFWGLTRDRVRAEAPQARPTTEPSRARPEEVIRLPPPHVTTREEERAEPADAGPESRRAPLDVGAVITKALRAAGLMR
jgi:feruloyl esterase